MIKMKTIYSLAICLLLATMAVNAQDAYAGKKAVAHQFVEAIFRQNKPAGFIIDSFFYLVPSDALPLQKRREGMVYLLDSLKKEKAGLLQTGSYEIIAYRDFTGPKKHFDERALQDILIVTVDRQPVLYLYCTDDKIRSFTLLEKPGQAYFLEL